MKTLVAYYSRAQENYFRDGKRYVEKGNTKKAAELISQMTGGDLFEIVQTHPYSADYDTCTKQALQDLKGKHRPELAGLPENMAQYDEVYLCYPNYWGTMPMAVYTFLEALDWQGKVIHPLCTHEGSGLSSTEKDIRNVTGTKVAKGLAVRGSDVDTSANVIKYWISRS